MQRRTPFLVLALSLAALTACGSTVQVTSTAQVGGGAGLGAGAAGALEPGVAVATDGAPLGTVGGAPAGTTATVTTPGTGAGSAVRPGQGSAPAVAGPGTATASIPTKGHGWDAKYVDVGVLTVNDLHDIAGGLGINLDPGDLEADARAVADYVNSHGGVLGRKVRLQFRDQGTVEVASNPETVGQEACTDLTQDRPVAVLFNYVTTLDTANFRSCFAKAGTSIFSASSAITDTEATRGLEQHFVQTAMVAWDKLAPVLVQRLQAQGWFGGWDVRLGQPSSTPAKIGIVSSTTKAGTRVAEQIRTALTATGHPGAVVYQWTDASQGQGSSVQYMQGNGVTHVIVTDLELTAFQNAAQNQQYKPRYGITSYNDPYTNLESLSPKGANNGALGIGWAPAYDVSDANDPGSTGPGQKRCLELMAKAGQSFSGKRTARLFAYATCDSILLAMEGAKAGRGFDAGSIYRGALQVSPTFSTAVSFGNAGLSPTHLFTPSSARDLAWSLDCSCFRYTSKGSTARF